jgi:protein-tyrosine phosphatase
MIDFHNHLIPSVDDGSESLEQSRLALESMAQQGISRVITTPHFSASTVNSPKEFNARMAAIDAGWAALLSIAGKYFPMLELHRGIELALDEPVHSLSDERTRLAGTKFVLIEFPYFTVPPNSSAALGRLSQLGVTPIIAHPERYKGIEDDVSVLGTWKEKGAYLQLNAGSLVGAYGSRVESNGWKVLEAGYADYLSSDYHARGTCLTASAVTRLEERRADAQMRMLTRVNGERLLHGMDPAPVGPLSKKTGWWQRFRPPRRRGE